MLGLEEVTVMVDNKDGHWMTVLSKVDDRNWVDYYFITSIVMADWFGSVEGFIQCKDKLLGDGGEFGIPDFLEEISDKEHEGCFREGPIEIFGKTKEVSVSRERYFLGKLNLN